MNKSAKLLLSFFAAAALAGCGGGGGGEPAPVMVTTTDTTVAAAPAVTAAVATVPFSFPTGVTQFGTTATTSVTFTNTAATPAFSIAADGHTATGTTRFGSCIFAVTSSSFPAGHALALGQTVTVNPCTLNVNTAGAVANGAATTRSVALVLGAAASANSSVTIGVNAGGQLSLNGNIVTTVVLTPVSG